MTQQPERAALLCEAKRRRKLYPTTAALRLAGLWFSGPQPRTALRCALDACTDFLPLPFLMFWINHPTGYVVVVPEVPAGLAPRTSCYLQGELVIEGILFRNVVCLRGQDLALGKGVAQHELAHLLDHLLGSDGQLHGPFLSDGAGVTLDLMAWGAELLACYRERNSVDPTAGGPHGYFARAVQTYCVAPERLRREDPRIFEFLEQRLLNEAAWWAKAPQDATKGGTVGDPGR
ncbi:MAG: hypothetical protein ACP5SI_10825 [Chloroflexia bacterium]